MDIEIHEKDIRCGLKETKSSPDLENQFIYNAKWCFYCTFQPKKKTTGNKTFQFEIMK